MMEVSMKNLLLQMESNSIRDSCMRFCRGKRGRRGGGVKNETAQRNNKTNGIKIKERVRGSKRFEQGRWERGRR